MCSAFSDTYEACARVRGQGQHRSNTLIERAPERATAGTSRAPNPHAMQQMTCNGAQPGRQMERRGGRGRRGKREEKEERAEGQENETDNQKRGEGRSSLTRPQRTTAPLHLIFAIQLLMGVKCFLYFTNQETEAVQRLNTRCCGEEGAKPGFLYKQTGLRDLISTPAYSTSYKDGSVI